MLTIVPSRGRPDNVAELIDVVASTRVLTKLYIAVDLDDPRLTDYYQVEAQAPLWVTWGYRGRLRLGPLLNLIGRTHMATERTIGFMGDDHRPRTVGWDLAVLDAQRKRPGIVYCNDLLQGANLPTQVWLDSRVIRAMDGMVPPTLEHLYLDNWWRDVGNAAGCLTYLPEVIVEHMHPVAKKANWDETYESGNDGAQWERDTKAYEELRSSGAIARTAILVQEALR